MIIILFLGRNSKYAHGARKQTRRVRCFLELNKANATRGGRRQSTMDTGMTQEMEALAFEDSQVTELTEEEAEESARAYDEAQVVLHMTKCLNLSTQMLEPHDQNA